LGLRLQAILRLRRGIGDEPAQAGTVKRITIASIRREASMKIWIALLVNMLLAACASYSGAGLKPGEARLEDLQSVMGPPAMRWQDADGSVQLAYPHGPAGVHTFMVTLGPDGRLRRIANALDEEGFAKIHAGLSQEQVLRVLGPPERSRTVYFAARDELVWDWRFCSIEGVASRFQVLFDASSGAVRSAIRQVERRNRNVEYCHR
jgi:hypothetical protein